MLRPGVFGLIIGVFNRDFSVCIGIFVLFVNALVVVNFGCSFSTRCSFCFCFVGCGSVGLFCCSGRFGAGFGLDFVVVAV